MARPAVEVARALGRVAAGGAGAFWPRPSSGVGSTPAGGVFTRCTVPTKKKTSAASRAAAARRWRQGATKRPAKAPTAKTAAKVAAKPAAKAKAKTARREGRGRSRRGRAGPQDEGRDQGRARGRTPEAAVARPTRARRGNDALVIVESPAKAKTIKKYLGAGYVVKASVGHVKDLPKKKMGIDIEHGFQPEYVVIDGEEEGAGGDHGSGARTPSRSSWRPTPIAKGRRSPGTSPRRCARRTRTSSASSSTRSPRRRSTRRSASRWSSTSRSSSRSRRAAMLDRLVGYQISPVLWTKVRRGPVGGARAVGRGAAGRRARGGDHGLPAARSTGRSRRWSRASAPPPFTAKFSKLDGKKAELTNEGRRPRGRRHHQGRVAGGLQRRAQGAAQEPAAAVHHLEAAAGGVEQAALLAQADDGARAAALRRRRGRRRRPGRSHHLHAYRLDAHLGRRGHRGARVHRRALRRDVPAGRARSSTRARRARRTRTRRSARPASSTIRRRSAPPGPAARAAGATSARATTCCSSTR